MLTERKSYSKTFRPQLRAKLAPPRLLFGPGFVDLQWSKPPFEPLRDSIAFGFGIVIHGYKPKPWTDQRALQ